MDTKLITWAAVIAITISSSSADEVEKAPVKESEGKFIPVVTRKLQGDVILAWISAMHNKLPMTQRQVGPFGLLQDPNQKVAVRKTKIVSSSGFLNAIKAMEINFVNSVDGQFAVGSREFKLGQVFSLVRGGQKYTTKIVVVKGSYIIFKDVNNGERIKKNLDVLPEGMTKNGKLEEIEGIELVKYGTDQPLNIP